MGKSENGAFSTNLITSGTVINGDITCDSDMRIDGVLSGNLTAKGKIVVGKTGDVKGEITCQNCDVEGSVNGKLTIKDLLSLRATAKFLGDIITTKLAIEPGAIFTGTCKMNGEKDATVEKK
ncbi:MAG: polymer-forming cytoskeletal protein [Bacteroidales bacterium]|jgi:cytoskeletal protein CcmA (bactofilin family)|nr:polymer-forming cytoskeletal protein [Bacteroidales bacterium]MBO7055938.1 polymer-forming cytoskeletal protein [Bacteroidales bacterium]MBO7125059.1 polymer-forming cytoskeletal protein [Bacteroidales bacterium]MBP5583725.1 polymer-forming cytoskeletal protein [Bacteroidales bacterium]